MIPLGEMIDREEIMVIITLLLDVEHLCNFTQVCRVAASRCNEAWSRLYQGRWGVIPAFKSYQTSQGYRKRHLAESTSTGAHSFVSVDEEYVFTLTIDAVMDSGSRHRFFAGHA